jgi:GNAT superfamily N-acetyltransferase
VTDPELRAARTADADALLRMERAAGRAVLGHVFPPEQFPYPSDEVRDRWTRVLHDSTSTTLIATLDGLDAGFASWSGDTLHHLGVVPEVHRRGIGSVLLAHAQAAILEEHAVARLWVLVENHAAIAFYERSGWQTTDLQRRAEFPPYPDELQMTKRR